MEVDVLVVGGGPGGSLAARYAAENGADTLMIEKRQEIGTPVRCGEGLSLHFNEDCKIPVDDKWVAKYINQARLIAPDGTEFFLDASMAGNEVGCNIHRDLFDKAMARAAIKAGSDVMLKTSAIDVLKEGDRIVGVKARHLGERLDIHAKVVIGADGFESQIGRWAGIDTKLNPSDIVTCFQYYLVGIDINPDTNDFYVGRGAPGGYMWVFPKGDNKANVGLGVQLSKIKGPGEVKAYLDAFVKKHPGLAKGMPIEMVAGAVSTNQPLDKTVANGIMLVGDAARLMDPLTGGGIGNACYSGMYAGQVAAKALEANDFSADFFQEYEKLWRDTLEAQIYRNWIAKEKASTMTDEQFNKVIDAVKDVDVEQITTLDILSAIQKKYPEMMKDFEDMI